MSQSCQLREVKKLSKPYQKRYPASKPTGWNARCRADWLDKFGRCKSLSEIIVASRQSKFNFKGNNYV